MYSRWPGRTQSLNIAGLPDLKRNAGNSVTLPVARRVQRVKPSPTLAVTARAARLREQGKDVIGLGAGEPDFDTPAHIAQAGMDAIQGGFTRYTNVEGIDELKDAIIAKFERDNALTYERSQILVSAGAKQTLYNLAMAVIDPGDEAITPQTRLLLLNSPCNPTGAAYTRAELRGLGEVLLEHPRILIGTDDMYEKIYWEPEPFCSLVTAVPELYHRTVTINGVSKAYAMTGWRLGYCGGPKEIIAAMSTIQGQSTSNACSISQKAATVALNSDQTCVARMTEAFKQRRDYALRALNSLPGVSCLPGSGTFYAFADVSRAISALGCRDDGEFAELLLNEAGVAVVPGSGFGAPGHMRLSFACSMPTLEQALNRIARILIARVDAA